jgi:hypothetical protein
MLALNKQILCFLYPSLTQICLSDCPWYAVEANRFLTYPLKQDLPHSSDLVLFLNGVAIIFILQWQAVPGSAVPFTSQAAEFSVSALQHSQHCCAVEVSAYILTLFFIAPCLQQNMEVLLRFFHVNCLSQWYRRKLISIVNLNCFKLTLDESVKSFHLPDVCSNCNSSINSWMLFQYARILSLSNTLLFLTACLYKMI